MKKYIIAFTTLLITNCAYADLLNSNYVSPERYAVNEADLNIDYSKIPPAPILNLDNLDNMRFNATDSYQQKPEVNTNKTVQEISNNDTEKNKQKKVKNKNTKNLQAKQPVVEETTSDDVDEAYKKKLSYKFAKWWVDQRYKREESHHGDLHEIKVQKRIMNEKARNEN